VAQRQRRGLQLIRPWAPTPGTWDLIWGAETGNNLSPLPT
jgi:hypothetical protein